MVLASQGMMNTFPWLTKLLMLNGKSKHPSRGLLFPKVSKYILVFYPSRGLLFPKALCLFAIDMHLSTASVNYVAYNVVALYDCMRATRL